MATSTASQSRVQLDTLSDPERKLYDRQMAALGPAGANSKDFQAGSISQRGLDALRTTLAREQKTGEIRTAYGIDGYTPAAPSPPAYADAGFHLGGQSTLLTSAQQAQKQAQTAGVVQKPAASTAAERLYGGASLTVSDIGSISDLSQLEQIVGDMSLDESVRSRAQIRLAALRSGGGA